MVSNHHIVLQVGYILISKGVIYVGDATAADIANIVNTDPQSLLQQPCDGYILLHQGLLRQAIIHHYTDNNATLADFMGADEQVPIGYWFYGLLVGDDVSAAVSGVYQELVQL